MNSHTIDQQLIPVLRQIEQNGIRIDTAKLEAYSLKISFKLEEITSEIDTMLGEKINLNSPSQLAKILFEKFKLKTPNNYIRRGKNHLSTGAETLLKLKSAHPVIEKILKYRELAKLKNTYLDPLPKLADKNNRLHTHYAIDTSTGRLSSKNPNLQNIPIKTELGQQIRRAFIANNGCKLIKADYSQIELRVIAHLSHDREMNKIFLANEDIHTKTAEELGCGRRTAKVVNFGVIYGMSAYGLSETLKIPTEEAQIFIDKYFLTYAGVKKYIDNLVICAEQDGFVETMFGRRREIPELQSENPKIRSFGARAAINTPVQGTAAEIIKLAMIKMTKVTKDSNDSKESNDSNESKDSKESNESNDSKESSSTSDSSESFATSESFPKMILQIHDELVFEVKNDKVNEAAAIIKDAMENAVKLSVPLKVDIKVGENWNDTK